MLSCGQFPEELAYKYLAHDVQSNAALQSFEDPILYKPIDPTSDTIIWLPLEDGGKKTPISYCLKESFGGLIRPTPSFASYLKHTIKILGVFLKEGGILKTL